VLFTAFLDSIFIKHTDRTVWYDFTKTKRSTLKSVVFQSKFKMVWKLFQAPMGAQFKFCDESSDFSKDLNHAQPDPFSEEFSLLSTWCNTGHPLAPSSPDTSDESKIAKSGITPRTHPPLRTNLSRRRISTHAPPRVNMSVEATNLGEPHQKQVLPSKAPKALPMPQDSQQVPTRRDHIRNPSLHSTKERHDESPVKSEEAKEGKEATVGLRRRQCTRPVLNSRSYTLQSRSATTMTPTCSRPVLNSRSYSLQSRSAKTMTPTPEQLSEHKKLSRHHARSKSERLAPVRTVKSASAA
jgi:hypothetical protein